jgi:endoglucanase
LLLTACGESGNISRHTPFEDPVPASETPVGRHGALQVRGGQLVDERGEAVQLRGVSSMWLNWETSGYATNISALRYMRDEWGISVFRAAMGVTGGDRRPVGNGYLGNPIGMEAQVTTIVEHALTLGLYVIIDWHDHYAQDNVDKSTRFFEKMARRYGDEPNVLYEPYNEPLTIEANGTGPYTWSEHIKPYHEAVLAAIRSRDPDNVVIAGTPNWSQFVDEAADDPLSDANLLYALHFYACTHEEWLRDRARQALSKGVGLFVTEWAATDASGGAESPELCLDEAARWLEFLDERAISWAAWKLDDCADASCLLRPGAPVSGDWQDWLQGQGSYIVEALRAEWRVPSDAGAGEASNDGGLATPDAESAEAGTRAPQARDGGD